MASQHIEINGTATRLNGELRRFTDGLRDIMNDHERLLGIFAEISNGGDWDALGDALDLSVADAQTVASYLSAIEDEMTATQLVTFVNRLG